jgi:long-chain acyl-CoA synthetase
MVHPQMGGMPGMFETALERAARMVGGKTAFACQDQSWSWQSLTDRAKSLAGGWRKAGLKPGDRVATLLANGLTAVEVYAASIYSGVMTVPLNFRWSQQEVRYALDDCTPHFLVFDDNYRSLALASVEGTSVRLLDSGTAGAGQTPHLDDMHADAPFEPVPFAADDLLAIFYTGGTTGRSKGVMLSRGNMFSNALAQMAEGLFGEHNTFLHASPMFHIAGALCVHAAFLSGSRNILLDRFDPGVALSLIESEGVNQTLWVPTMIGAVLDHPASATTDVSSMGNLLYGAAPITQTLLERAMLKFSNAQFTQLYGMTETSPTATVLHSREFAGPNGVPERARAAGRPVYGTEVRIGRPDGTECARGEVGEIMTRGPGVMKGYWNMPEATAEAVKSGWMHTGDGGYMDDDGFVYLADRLKDMIISGGENVFSVEVENVVAAHPVVNQCAVVGIPHEQWGEAVHAILVLNPGMDATDAELIQFCRLTLPGFKVPRSFERRDTPLPLSAAGKVLKRELRAPYWSQVAG